MSNKTTNRLVSLFTRMLTFHAERFESPGRKLPEITDRLKEKQDDVKGSGAFIRYAASAGYSGDHPA